MTLEITDKNFETLIINNSKPSVLDFWAPRCGPCTLLSPHIEALAEEYQEQVNVGKVNADENSELLLKFGVRSIPTILYLKNGEVVNKLIGYSSKNKLEAKLKSGLLDDRT